MGYLTVPGGAVEYRLIPADSGREPLVFLHEGLGCAAAWGRFPDRVARATGRPALVYSRHGYGHSAPLPALRGPDYLHHEARKVLPELLRRLSQHRPLLVGHSDGASIALLHAATYPVAAVVAIAPHVFVEPLTRRGITAAAARFRDGDLARRLARLHDDPHATFWSWAQVWLSPAFTDWNIEAELAEIRCPVMLLQGARDEYGSTRQLDAIAARVAGPVHRHELPGCGHQPVLERPELTFEAIVRFARSLPPGAPAG